MRRAKPAKLPQSYALEFSPPGNFIVALGTRVARWDSENRKVRYRCHPLKHPSSCAVHPDETCIAIKNTSGRIVVIAADDGRVLRELCGTERGEGSDIAFSSCGNFLVDGSWNGDLLVRSVATGRVEFERKFAGDLISQILHQPSTDQWLTLHVPRATRPDAPGEPNYFCRWTWPFSEPTGVLRLQEPDIQCAALSQDGSLICVVNTKAVAVFRLADGVLLGTAPHTYGGTSFSVAWSPEGLEVGVVGKHVVTLYSAPDLSELNTIPLQYASDIRYSPDGLSIALGSWGSGLLIPRSELNEVQSK